MTTSNVIAVAYKEAAILRHDKAVLSLIVAQPIMMLLIMGFVVRTEPANVPWAVWDQSRSALSRELVRAIQATGYFLDPQTVPSSAAGRELLRTGKALAFVVIPKNLRRDLERSQPEVQLLMDGSDPLTVSRVGSYIGMVAATVGADEDPRKRRDGPADVPSPVAIKSRFWFNPTLGDARFFLASLAAMLLTNFCMSVSSLGLVGEKESGTYEQMLALPTTPLELVLGKLVPHLVISFGILFYTVVANGLVFGYWPEGSLLALIAVTLPFVLASLSIGVFISTLVQTSAQAVFIIPFFIMPSFVLSGVLLPYQLMPDGIRQVGALFPLRWFQIGSRRVLTRGAGFAEVLVPIAVLFVMWAVLLAAIRWRMKPRLS